MDVSIIIVNYNTLEMTKACIDSIFKYTSDVGFEIILVDNASNDGSKEFFSCDDRIKYIYCGDNLGFGKANNLGLQYAKGRYLFLLNSDTLFLNNAVKIFLDYATNAVEDVGCIGTFLLDENHKVTHSFGSFPTYKNTIDEWVIYPILRQLKLKNKPSKYDPSFMIRKGHFYVDYITGADIFVKRDIVLNHGLFDPDFFMYYEETEMQFRYRKMGYKSVMIEGPEIIHICQGSSIGDIKFRKKPSYLKGLYLFFLKHKNHIGLFVFWPIFLCFCILVILLYPVSFTDKKYVIKHLLYRSFYNIV